MKKFVSLLFTLTILMATMPGMFIYASVSNYDTIEFNGHHYARIDQSMTWKEAKKYCEEQGGYLATITSEEEQNIIQNLIKGGEKAQYWLGGTDEAEEGTWVWVTGEPWNYWYKDSHIDNYRSNEHYLQMQRHHWGNESALGYWNDINNENYIPGEESFFSTDMTGIVCEWENDDQSSNESPDHTSDWAKEEIQKAYDYDLVPEVLKDKDLTQRISRAEFAAVSVKTFENLSPTPAIPAVTDPFTDTKDLDVLKAFNLGIVNGYGGGLFGPDDYLNREQCATMLTRAFKKVTMPGWSLENDSQFTLRYTRPALFADDSLISSWAKDSVYFMVANNIIKGMGDNLFVPRNITSKEEAEGYATATREQALVIAVRMVENLK